MPEDTPSANAAGRGDLIFLDGSLNLNNAASLTDTKFGASIRLVYRWLAPRHNWIVGFNAGLDVTPYQSTYFTQAAAELELLGKQLGLRLKATSPSIKPICCLCLPKRFRPSATIGSPSPTRKLWRGPWQGRY
jgi:hypothetical protein